MDALRAPKLIGILRVANRLSCNQRLQLLLDGALVYQSLALRIIETIAAPRTGRVKGQKEGERGGEEIISVGFTIHIEKTLELTR